MNRMSRINRRFYRWCNKTPNKPWETYLAVNTSGIILGIALMGGALLIDEGSWILGVLLMIAGALVYWMLYRIDKERGYVDALQKHYLERREKLMKELDEEGDLE